MDDANTGLHRKAAVSEGLKCPIVSDRIEMTTALPRAGRSRIVHRGHSLSSRPIEAFLELALDHEAAIKMQKGLIKNPGKVF
jgi:hypothetical protein